MTTLTPITVEVQITPQRVFVDPQPLQNQVQVNPQKNAVEVRSPGIQGRSGTSEIAGYGFDIQSLTSGDVLQFGGAAWVNTPQTEITDGGNF